MSIETDFSNTLSTSRLKTREVGIVETASLLTESHRHTDIYKFTHKKGVLYSPTHKQFVKDSTNNPSDTIFIQKLQKWFDNNDMGTAVWISLPQYTEEKDPKIVIMTIQKGRNYKMIHNESTPIPLSEEEIVSLAEVLFGDSVNPLQQFTNFQELREDLIIMTNTVALDRYIRPYLTNWEQYKKYIRIADNANSQPIRKDSIRILVNSAGNFRPLCLTIGVNSPFNNKIVNAEGGKTLRCKCPVCKKEVTADIYGGKIHCPECGASAEYHC